MNDNRVVQAAYFILRVVVALMFIQHGGQKLFGWFGGMPGGGTPPLTSQIGIGGILEFFGGILIFIGLCTRPVAFILCGEMAVAYFQQHQPHGMWPIQNKGEPAVLYCFAFLLMAAYGAGEYSLDALIRRKKSTA